MLKNSIIRIAAALSGCILCVTGCIQPGALDTGSEDIRFTAGSMLLRDDATKATDPYYDNTSFGVFSFKQKGGTWANLSTKHWKPNYMFNQEVHHENAVFSYSPIRFWPDAADGILTFWAYSPYDASANLLEAGKTTTYTNSSEGLPDIRFSADGQTDILYSDVVADQTYSSNSGTVNLSFNHALSLVEVNADKIDPDGNFTVTLNSVIFKGLYQMATLGFRSPVWTWSNYGPSKGDISVWNGEVILEHNIPSQVLGSVMPLPQNLSDDAARLQVMFSVSYEDPSDHTTHSYSTTREVYLRDAFNSVGGIWAMNSHYTLTIGITPGNPILFTVSWDNWGADHNYILSN